MYVTFIADWVTTELYTMVNGIVEKNNKKKKRKTKPPLIKNLLICHIILKFIDRFLQYL